MYSAIFQNFIQRKFYDFVSDTKFEVFVVTCIFINMIFMAIEHYQQPQYVRIVLAELVCDAKLG